MRKESKQPEFDINLWCSDYFYDLRLPRLMVSAG
jgi:hypothetical protein